MADNQPIHSAKNEYLGVNAHLQSELQQEHGDWQSFHSEHIVDLSRAIGRILPAGYYASTESSLQIRTQSVPDVTILQRPQPEPEPSLRIGSAAVAEAVEPAVGDEVYVISLELLEEDEEYFRAVMIYQPDKPVTRIELLSPSNKPPSGSHQNNYESRRRETLVAGIHIVEIDYLHQTAPIHSVSNYIPNYAVKRGEPRDAKASAYSVAITRIGERLQQTLKLALDVYHFGVDQPAPAINIPLLNNAAVALKLGEVYNYTFEAQPRWALEVDYARLPPAFDTYSPADQQKIVNRMQAVHDKFNLIGSAKHDEPA